MVNISREQKILAEGISELLSGSLKTSLRVATSKAEGSTVYYVADSRTKQVQRDNALACIYLINSESKPYYSVELNPKNAKAGTFVQSFASAVISSVFADRILEQIRKMFKDSLAR